MCLVGVGIGFVGGVGIFKEDILIQVSSSSSVLFEYIDNEILCS